MLRVFLPTLLPPTLYLYSAIASSALAFLALHSFLYYLLSHLSTVYIVFTYTNRVYEEANCACRLLIQAMANIFILTFDVAANAALKLFLNLGSLPTFFSINVSIYLTAYTLLEYLYKKYHMVANLFAYINV
jgi:hypothetical protein